MYNQGAQLQPEQVAPVLKCLSDIFEKEIQIQQDCLSKIESKLNDIFNMRVSQAQGEGALKEASVVDFTESLNKKLAILINNNDRLSQILNHLSRII